MGCCLKSWNYISFNGKRSKNENSLMMSSIISIEIEMTVFTNEDFGAGAAVLGMDEWLRPTVFCGTELLSLPEMPVFWRQSNQIYRVLCNVLCVNGMLCFVSCLLCILCVYVVLKLQYKKCLGGSYLILWQIYFEYMKIYKKKAFYVTTCTLGHRKY